ncbi:MAG: hypothetical protein QGI92_04315 [Dehalococcoidales bacterium]|jgi:hypothetical protein|nr:hypothetical protein [Dehalococcoidales bacterium]MDP7309875.1 hypothetical protein [Dehalococcoidales bacterium]MDP7676186.1 hypothetical protein [Dehalococcoidales bacterium]HJM36513.1 hypothetical protein [Dehalococcoidales bacterium]
MIILVALVLAILTTAVVLLPFFRQGSHPISTVTDEKSQELLFKRDTTYSVLKELEFDYQSGILNEEDYHVLEAKYKRKGVSILKEINNLPKDTETDATREKPGSSPTR